MRLNEISQSRALEMLETAAKLLFARGGVELAVHSERNLVSQQIQLGAQMVQLELRLGRSPQLSVRLSGPGGRGLHASTDANLADDEAVAWLSDTLVELLR